MPIMQMLFDRTDVRIDNAKAVIKGITYPIRAISSFSISENRFGADRIVGTVVLFIGIGFLGVGELPSILLGLGIIAIGAYAVIKGKNEYTLRLTTNAGERDVLKTKDKELILAIREALNQAIASPQ